MVFLWLHGRKSDDIQISIIAHLLMVLDCRVDGRGPAVISEVSFQAKHLAGSDVEINQKQKELKDKLVPLEKKKASAESKRTRLQKQRDVLFGFADNLMQPAEKADKVGAWNNSVETIRSHTKDLLYQP